MISPASTRQARWRRNVAGAMPWARIESSLLEGNTTMPGPGESLSPALEALAGKVSAVSWWNESSACSTDNARSVTPSGSLASVSARNIRHLCTTVSDAPGLAAKFSVAAWLATMASDNGRRPKGVVEKFRSMTLLSCFGQSRNARRIGAPTLTRESERLIRIFAKRTRRLSSWFAAWGPFFLPLVYSLQVVSRAVASSRPIAEPIKRSSINLGRCQGL